MNVSPGANAIIQAARFNPHDDATVARLIEQHGIPAAVEAICLMARIIPQGSNTPYRPKG